MKEQSHSNNEKESRANANQNENGQSKCISLMPPPFSFESPPVERTRNEGLPEEVQTRMENGFGHDFSNVKIHKDSDKAVEMNALAYARGNEVHFAPGEFNPNSQRGLELIGHEFAHVVQQREGRVKQTVQGKGEGINDDPILEKEADELGKSVVQNRILASKGRSKPNNLAKNDLIQRAEVDSSSIQSSDIQDSAADINNYVNENLEIARSRGNNTTEGIMRELFSNIAQDERTARSIIEIWASRLGSNKVHSTSQQNTKYQGVEYGIWRQWVQNFGGETMNPIIKVNDILIGTDKLGHFFQQGFQYYESAPEGDSSNAERLGRNMEEGGFGLSTTGVYSNADLEANRKGLEFYRDLANNHGIVFNINNYINSDWDEESNPNMYVQDVAEQVWANILTNNNWTALIGIPNAEPSHLVDGNVRFSVTGNQVDGNFIYENSGQQVSGQIHGRIRHLIHSGTRAVHGIQILFDWVSGNNSGKGTFDSINEQSFTGAWGYGENRIGHVFNIER